MIQGTVDVEGFHTKMDDFQAQLDNIANTSSSEYINIQGSMNSLQTEYYSECQGYMMNVYSIMLFGGIFVSYFLENVQQIIFGKLRNKKIEYLYHDIRINAFTCIVILYLSFKLLK